MQILNNTKITEGRRMMDMLELPLTLVIKAPNQKIADTTINCEREWTIKKLKEHLSQVYPSKPCKTKQKIIYSGKLLQDHLVLKDVLRQFEPDQTTHTVHLVCASSMETSPSTSSSSISSSVSDGAAASTSGLRRRRGDSDDTTAPTPSASSSTTAVPSTANLGAPQAMEGPAMDQMYLQYAAAAGGPMMAAAAAMYSPEQLMWLQQQMYAQQMAQYMQYYQGYGMAAPAAAAAMPAPPAEGGAAEAPAPAARRRDQPVRMNAQGGPVMDDDEDADAAERDWLDWVYTLSRFGVLVSIVYFYSTLHRFFIVLGLFFMVYLYEAGWLRRRRRQQQQRGAQEAPAADIADANEPADVAAAAAAPPDNADGQEAEQAPAEPPTPPAPSRLQVAWCFVATFFTSLFPAQPQQVNAN